MNILSVKIIPGKSKTECIGTMSDGALKIHVRAVPEGGKANKELLGFLKKTYGGTWEILQGKTFSRKVVRKKGE